MTDQVVAGTTGVKTPAQTLAEAQAKAAANTAAAAQQKAQAETLRQKSQEAQEKPADAKVADLNKTTDTTKTNTAASLSGDLAAQLKAKTIDNAKAAVKEMATPPASDVTVTALSQQTASPFMPGAPASGPNATASAGLAPASSGLQVMPPVIHADDMPKADSEKAVAEAQHERTQSEVTKPKLLSPQHSLFYSNRPNLGASTPDGIVRFTDHYAQTDNPAQIQYLKDNASHFSIRPA